jgi:hypothetical protein
MLHDHVTLRTYNRLPLDCLKHETDYTWHLRWQSPVVWHRVPGQKCTEVSEEATVSVFTSTLEPEDTSQTVYFYQTTRSHNQEDINLQELQRKTPPYGCAFSYQQHALLTKEIWLQ